MKRKSLTFLWIFTFLIGFTIYKSGVLTSINKKIPPLPKTALPSQSIPKITNDQSKDPVLRFVVMADCRGSDMGVNTKIVSKTFERIKGLEPKPQFAVMPGDLVGGAESYSEIKSQMLHFKDIITKYYPIGFFYPGFGNHEASGGEAGEKAFGEVFSEINANLLKGYNNTVYYFDSGNTRFYMLNSNHPGESHIISDAQLNWIKGNSTPNKLHNIYFFHEPAYPTGAHIGNSLDANPLQRDKLWEIIDNSKGSIAFCGHEHNYTRRHINSDFNETINGRAFNFKQLIYQVTTGTFGAPIYKDYKDKRNVDVPPIPEYNFAVVDIRDGKVNVTAYNVDGEIIDQFEQ